MKNAVIMTAKGGNTSVENKNVIPILGVPICAYPLRAAKLASLVDGLFCSTEDSLISTIARKEGAEIIQRPPHLSRSDSNIGDAITHATQAVAEKHPEVENFIVLLGNTVQVTPGIIDRCFRVLMEEDCDSVATVWMAQDDHPYRAMIRNEAGYMESFMKVDVGPNRQSYPTVYFYDQGIWGYKKHCALERKGPSPWTWLGSKCKMIERPWVTGRDIHTWIDVSASVWYLNSIQVNDYMGYRDL